MRLPTRQDGVENRDKVCLKKKKTSGNTTLKHSADMVKYTHLERSSLSSLIC